MFIRYISRFLAWCGYKISPYLKNVKNRTHDIQCRNWEHRQRSKFHVVHQYFPNKCTSKHYVIAITSSKTSSPTNESYCYSRRLWHSRHHKCVLYYIYLSILSWMILLFFSWLFFVQWKWCQKRRTLFQCTLPKFACIHFLQWFFLVRHINTLDREEKLVPSFFFWEIKNTNTLGNKILYIIACCLQFHSFIFVKPVKRVMADNATRNVMEVDLPATCNEWDNTTIHWHFGIYLCDIRYALIVRWTSFSILWAFCWMNLHFSPLTRSIFFSLLGFSWLISGCCQCWIWQCKNMLIFYGSEFVIFGHVMEYKFLSGIRL